MHGESDCGGMGERRNIATEIPKCDPIPTDFSNIMKCLTLLFVLCISFSIVIFRISPDIIISYLSIENHLSISESNSYHVRKSLQALSTSPFLISRQLDSMHSRPKYGIAMCVGSKMVQDAHAVIDQLRSLHNCTLPIVLAHCEELTLQDIDHFQKDFGEIGLLDICQQGKIFGMDQSQMRSRLRSWYCKTAIAVLAPFDEVMIMDLDTIWMGNPDSLFHYPMYRKTGALFMRDRMTYDKPGRGFQRDITNFIETQNPNISISFDYAHSKVSQDGINLFWRAFLDPNVPTYNNFQDSSMFIVNRIKHPRLLTVLAEILPRFNMGWGDKEIYWIASIIAQESYAFEPFLFSLYGPCGVIMHNNPNDYKTPFTARPLYINAEWLVEKIGSIGHDLDYEMPNPVVAASNTSLIDIGHLRGCACAVFGCRPVPKSVTNHVLRAQWERKTRYLSHSVMSVDTYVSLHLPKSTSPLPHRPDALTYTLTDAITGKNQTWYLDIDNNNVVPLQLQLQQTLPCVIIFLPVASDISDMNRWLIERQECSKLGCAYAPIPVHANYSRDTFCLPVSFSPYGPESELQHWTMFLQLPPPRKKIPDGVVLKGANSRSVYLMENQVLRVFPNGDTFIKMGYEWGQVQVFQQNEVDSWPKGPDLPSK